MQTPFTFFAVLFSGLAWSSSASANTPLLRPETSPSGGNACLTVSAGATNALCNGDNSGAVNATASGGSGTYQFVWQGCAGGPTYNTASVTNLIAGCYGVTVTDGNGCSGTATVQVFEPSPFRFTITADSVRCYGAADATAAILVKGGTPGYRYLWDNGQTTAQATGFNAGVHFLEVTDSLGCRAITTFEVWQPTPVKLDSQMLFTPNCFGDENGSAEVFISGGTGAYTYQWSNAASTSKAEQLKAGMYTVSVLDQKGCLFVHQVSITEPEALSFRFSQIVDEKCPGACNGAARIEILGGTGPYLLTWDDVLIETKDTTATALCPERYILRIIDGKGCIRYDSFDIKAATPPGITFSALPPTCLGTTDGALSVTVANGNPPFRYNWSNGATDERITGLNCGDFRITITDAFDCVYVDSTRLDCPPALVLDTIEVQKPRCTGEQNGAIRVTVQGGTPPLGYLWSDPNAQTSAVASNLKAGIYTVTVRDKNNCTLVATDTIEDIQPIVVTLTSTDVRCYGSNDGSVVATVGGGTYPYTYDWSHGDLDSIAEALAPGVYFLAVSDAAGCAPPVVAANIQGPASPLEVVAIQNKRACAGANDGKAAAFPRGGNTGPYTYVWSNAMTNDQIGNLPAGLYTVTVRDIKQCEDTATVRIGALDSLKIKLASGRPSCFGEKDGSAAIVDFDGGTGDSLRYQFQWDIAPGVNSPFITNLEGGRTYYVTVTDNENCTTMDSIPVDQGPRVIPKLAVTQIRCFGEINGAINVVSVQSGAPVRSYTWSNGETTAGIGSLPPGLYTVTVADERGCKGVDSVRIVEPPAIRAVMSVINALRCSEDKSGVLSVAVSGGTPDYALRWSHGDTTYITRQLGKGIYSVTVTDRNGCTDQQQLDMPTPDSIQLQAVAIPPRCFNDDNGRFNLSAQGGTGPYVYSINNGAYIGAPSFFRLTAGTYTLRVKDTNGCISTIISRLDNPPPLSVSLGRDTIVEPGTELILAPDLSNAFGAVAYDWDLAPLDALVCTDAPLCSEIVVAPYRDTWYELRVTDEHGCEAMDAMQVRVTKRRDVLVPTAFSPNDDGANDLLQVHGSATYIKTILTMAIYDRWGELVYQDTDMRINDASRGWDGTFRGEPCDPGVFVWKMEVEFVDGYREFYTGNITLVR